jgi:hypothetical protein
MLGSAVSTANPDISAALATDSAAHSAAGVTADPEFDPPPSGEDAGEAAREAAGAVELGADPDATGSSVGPQPLRAAVIAIAADATRSDPFMAS